MLGPRWESCRAPSALHVGSLLAPGTGVTGLPLTEKSHGKSHPFPWEHRDLGSRVTLEECRASFLYSISERIHGLAGVQPGHRGCVPAMELGPVTQRSPDSRGAAPGFGEGRWTVESGPKEVSLVPIHRWCLPKAMGWLDASSRGSEAVG